MSTAINTTRAYTSYEVVTMHDLNDGDIITSHGGMFRLTNRHVSEAHESNGPGGECIVFDGVFLGDSFSDCNCGIPAHWRENEERTSHRGGNVHGYWTVQGNKLAKECRITNTSLQYYHGRDDSGVGVWTHEPVMIWNKIQKGIYETNNRRFQVQRRPDGTWMLLSRNDDVVGNWDWCQSFGLLRDAQAAAKGITS